MNPARIAIIVTACAFGSASPVAAQSADAVAPTRPSIRLVGTLAVERFSADTTFGAIFGQPVGAVFGGGARVDVGTLFVEATASRFRRTGQRGFAAGDEGFGLDIPLTVTISPVEVAAGYRFRNFRRSVTPYVGTGLGVYRYKETSPAAEPGEEVDERHAGWLFVAGAEMRVHRWLALGADLHYSYVPGILGQAGLSKEADEHSLGGVAARFRVIVGR
jgi:opacity protein-like surface antigen